MDESFEDRADEQFDEDAEPKYTISPAGRELFVGVLAIEGWLDHAPGGPLSLIEDEESQAIVGAFIEGWGTMIIHALAAGPLTLAELQQEIDEPDREELEAKVAAMRGTGLLSAHPSDGEGASYAVTDWLREGVGPLVVAMRSELRQKQVLAEEAEAPPPEDPVYSPTDVEAAFLLSLPLLELPTDLSGVCRLVVDLPESDEGLAGATIDIEGGRVTACNLDVEGDADAWALGPTPAWLDATVEGQTKKLEFGGDERLSRGVLAGIRRRLFKSDG